MKKKQNKDYIHKEYPKTCDPKDFFGQVKRTVNGKPIPEEQIQMIVTTIKKKLDLHKNDFLFDIGCGNAALASYLFDDVKGYLGVDFSEYLIKVGKENFEKPGFELILSDAILYLKELVINEDVTKVLCYGVFSYFSDENVNLLFDLLLQKFPNLKTVFIGNIPDRERAELFYYSDIDFSKLLDDEESSIGKWWSKTQLSKIINNDFFEIQISNMPDNFYSSHYRFDLILNKK